MPKPANDNSEKYRDNYIHNIKVSDPTSKLYKDSSRLPNGYSRDRETECHAKIMHAIFLPISDISVESWGEYFDKITKTEEPDYVLPELKGGNAGTAKMVALLAGQASGKTTFKNILCDQGVVPTDSTVFVSTGLMLNQFPETSAEGLTKDQKEDGIAKVRDEILHLQQVATQIALANDVSIVLDIHVIEKEQAEALCQIAEKQQATSMLLSPHISLDTYAKRVTVRSEEEGRLPFKDEHVLFHQIFSYNFYHNFRFMFDECLLIDNNAELDSTASLSPIYSSQKLDEKKIQEVVYDLEAYARFVAKKRLEPDEIQKQIDFMSSQQGLSVQEKTSKIKTFLKNKSFDVERHAHSLSENVIDVAVNDSNVSPKVSGMVCQILQAYPITDAVVCHTDIEARNAHIICSQFKKAAQNNWETSSYDKKLPGTISASSEKITIIGFDKLPPVVRNEIQERLPIIVNDNSEGNLSFPRYAEKDGILEEQTQAVSKIGKLLKKHHIFTDNKKFKFGQKSIRGSYSHAVSNATSFTVISQKAREYADFLEENKENIAHALEDYECYNVVLDEINRSKELLNNLDKNEDYFSGTVGGVTTFLPLNQPIYATVCFGVIPSLMAEDASLRPPTAMQNVFSKLQEVIALEEFFPNLSISYDTKEQFVAERNRKTDVVIFTGMPENGNKVRKQFPKKTLFILNGSGHNPLVVTPTADIKQAVDSALSTVLQNQGQDCAGPNAILVHIDKVDDLKDELLKKLSQSEQQVGDYKDRNNIVGPNTDPNHTIKITRLFAELRDYHLYGGEVNPITGMIKPTVFEKPLVTGPNHKEFFAPVFMIQPYDKDADLALYFENSEYAKNAMYVSVFGNSPYISSLIEKGLHDENNILRNTDLHVEEKGYMPYGGYGPGASCLYVNGVMVKGATLPQRDIYEQIIKAQSQDIAVQYGCKQNDDGYYETQEPV